LGFRWLRIRLPYWQGKRDVEVGQAVKSYQDSDVVPLTEDNPDSPAGL
jgi:hypothetical protein